METTLSFDYFVPHSEEGRYLTLPFTMPPGVETFFLTYRYERRHPGEPQAGFTPRLKANTIDLGLLAPNGSQVGASGSDKSEITLSATHATPGYQPCELVPGEWRILLGAYKVAPEGVTVHYDLRFTPKVLRLFKGDLHAHTLGSDGVLTAGELGQHALRHGLDFLAVTDHNQASTAASLPRLPGLTFIPGVEWTHYQGHFNFLGVDQPYDLPFFADSFEELRQRFLTARERGALITLNHPFEEECPLRFPLDSLPWDCLEVWNGPMRESNLRALGLWQSLLAAGKKVPICGGSDYHRSQLFLFPGGPTTCIQALSPSVPDLLLALRQGHAYIVYAPDGPSLQVRLGQALLGDTVPFPQVQELEIQVTGLRPGDILQVVTASGSTPLARPDSEGDYAGTFRMPAPGFARLELLRVFVPGLPPLPALVGNPVWFEAA